MKRELAIVMMENPIISGLKEAPSSFSETKIKCLIWTFVQRALRWMTPDIQIQCQIWTFGHLKFGIHSVNNLENSAQSL